MTDENRIAELNEVLAKARRTSFGDVTPEEKEELTKLSKKRPQDVELIKDGSRSKVGSYQLKSGREVILKYYYPTHIVKKLRNRLTGSRCRRSWIAAHGFLHLGIPTPRPLAIAEFHQLGLFNSMSFLATDHVKGVQLRFLEKSRYETIAPALRSAFETMAEFRLAHGDLKNTNIVINEDNEITFVDLDATRFNLSEKSWERAQTHDRKRFHKNWKDNPYAAGILNDCIS